MVCSNMLVLLKLREVELHSFFQVCTVKWFVLFSREINIPTLHCMKKVGIQYVFSKIGLMAQWVLNYLIHKQLMLLHGITFWAIF